MPDHIHFLLILDYEQAPWFNPLWFSFVLVEAIELAWSIDEKPRGGCQNNEGTGALPPRPCLPEDAGGSRPPEEILGEVLARSRRCARDYEILRELDEMPQGSGGGASVRSSFLAPQSTLPPSPSKLRFDRHPCIEISFDARQLKAIRRYIRLNSARAIWKREHPDRFHCFENIRHQVLDPSRKWSAIGNLTLLASPLLFHVRLTLKKSVAEHEKTIAEILGRARRGWIPVSGFLSPGKVEVLRRLKADPIARFIKVLPFALPVRYDPSTEDSRELAADRMLLLSGFHNVPEISSWDMKRDSGASRQFREKLPGAQRSYCCAMSSRTNSCTLTRNHASASSRSRKGFSSS